MTARQIYLDFNASTPLAPEVVEAMRPFLTAAGRRDAGLVVRRGLGRRRGETRGAPVSAA